MTDQPPLVPFLIPAYPKPLSISQARVDLPPEEFRLRLRRHLQDHPHITLHQVAQQLNVTRQRINILVGKLNRPTCAHPDRPAPKREAPKREAAKLKLADLRARVAGGEPAEAAAAALGISLHMAMRLGFRSREARPPHGSQGKLRGGCGCWRCRRAGGIALPRGPKTGLARRAAVEDWLAWTDPDDGTTLTQAEVGRLVGVGQGAVSRIARG